ncbi:exodeoxyribonuclease VII small subunit [Fodinibius halophilus]|uniref:Exodeoxyribonuclease 7 small subunit n=1 Tax=Fodinibius halophilus TaxID=1736908 RepID=A0A6M1T028_9BACT|nr:exodeoxyribonuclease VII small subunit [Fodinibius halophilus]NGP87307.1 exodeoxyribonuclease VII small subunit [Fodinibius halophilus]
MSKKERPSFEEALSRLESIVKELEDESISLEKSIELYEEGIKLSNLCTETLEEAELRIENVAEQHANDNDNE